MRARIILPALLLILALAGAWVWRGLAPSVAIATASIGPAVQAVYATGNVEPVHWARVGPAVRARITAVLVEEGVIVAEGATAPDGGPHAERRALEALGRPPRPGRPST